MSLGDFITLTEMNNGLSAPDRVKELIGLMRKGTDCVINNVSDEIQQWSTVARAIASTENKECLLLFVQLDGLIYMNKWLKDASDFVNKTNDRSVEDVIIDLLRAFTRIEADSDKLVTSRILITVKDIGHNNPKVRDMAKSLLELWNKEKPRKAVTEAEDIGMPDKTEIRVSERHAGENGNLGPSNGNIDTSQGSSTSEIRQDIAKDALLSTSSESLKDEEIKKTSSDIEISKEDNTYATNSKSFPDPLNSNLDKLEPPVSCSEESPSAEACIVVGHQQGIRKEEINGSELDPTITEEPSQEMVSSSQMLDKKLDPKEILSTNDTGTLHSEIEPYDIKIDNAEERNSVGEVSDCLKTAVSEADKKINNFPKQKNRKNDHSIKMKSDSDLDYDFSDPLELARLVANEVEREVEDCSELSCRSSDKEMSSKLRLLESSNYITGEQCHAESSAADVSTQPDVTLDSPTEEDHITSAQCLDPGSQEDRSPQVIEAAQVVAANTDEFLCHFDLNQDVCLEDVEHQGDTTSPPVSIVSATRAAAAPLMPVGPLQFEGALGWKGSAATSAFRPASPRRVPESDFTLSAGGGNSSSKGNHSILNIDLNLAETRDNKQIPVSCQLASLDSSAEASSRRPGRLEFDLNQISDDGIPPEQYLFQQVSGHRNQSYSASSSKQPSLRNMDIDQPTLVNDLSSCRFHLKSPERLITPGSEKPNDSVISIMGKRVEVNRRDSSVKPVLLTNIRTAGPLSGFNLESPGDLLAKGSPASYPHPHIFGLNDLPPGYPIPFSSPAYGSGGAIPNIVPQFLSSSTISTAFPQPPYPFSMTEMPTANGVGLSREDFYLNSGTCTERSDLDLGGLRQLFNHTQPRPFDEHMKSNSQPSTGLGIGIGGKRKEPENGWESCPLVHQQPWR